MIINRSEKLRMEEEEQQEQEDKKMYKTARASSRSKTGSLRIYLQYRLLLDSDLLNEMVISERGWKPYRPPRYKI